MYIKLSEVLRRMGAQGYTYKQNTLAQYAMIDLCCVSHADQLVQWANTHGYVSRNRGRFVRVMWGQWVFNHG